MPRSILLAPHADDETLFASYVCQRHRPLVVVCFEEGRTLSELGPAMDVLGCDWLTLNRPKGSTVEEVKSALFIRGLGQAEEVWAPVWHPQGHEEHNLVANVAAEVFGLRIRRYLTYAPRGQRQTEGVEVKPSGEMIHRKLRALACYVSQIEDPATRPWFYELLDMREWVT